MVAQSSSAAILQSKFQILESSHQRSASCAPDSTKNDSDPIRPNSVQDTKSEPILENSDSGSERIPGVGAESSPVKSEHSLGQSQG